MIKFRAEVEADDGSTRDVICLALTDENVKRLTNGEPIQVDTSQPPPEGLGVGGGPMVFLFHRPDEAAILEKLQELGIVGDTTAVHLSDDLVGDGKADLEMVDEPRGMRSDNPGLTEDETAILRGIEDQLAPESD